MVSFNHAVVICANVFLAQLPRLTFFQTSEAEHN